MATTISEREKRKWPSQPEPNPRAQIGQQSQPEGRFNQVNTIHTLRSERQVDNQVGITENQEDQPTESQIDQTKSDEPESTEVDEPSKPITESIIRFKQVKTSTTNPIASFFNRLRSNRQSAHIDQILEIFK